MNKTSYILIAIIALFATSIANAEPRISVTYVNYVINGNNINEIKQAILVYGLKDGHGNVFAAKTSPKFSWKYNFKESTSGCFIKSADVETQITYQLPQLESSVKLSENDKAEWNRYYSATLQHEQGHTNLSIETARTIENTVLNISPKSSCGEAVRTANMLISNILNRHEHNNLDYDTQTAHGVAQGAVLAVK